MVNSPVPFRSSSSASPYAFLLGKRPNSGKRVSEEPDPAAIFAAIREQITSGAHSPEEIFGAIAVVAQALISAAGAAVAIRCGSEAVCVGRSGETAPEIGARLSLDSGISGACLRTGQILRCDDTQTDERVDAEVCLRMGIRSIVALPLRHDGKTIGILEAFSMYAYVFAEKDMQNLAGLAELAEMQYARMAAAEEAVAAPKNAATPAEAVTVAADMLLTQESTLSRLRSVFEPRRERPYWRVGAALGVLVFAVTVWLVMRSPDSEPVQELQPPQAEVEPAAATLPMTEAITTRVSRPAIKKTAEVKYTKPSPSKPTKDAGYVEDVVVRDLRGPSQKPSDSSEATTDERTSSPASNASNDSPVEAPQIVASTTSAGVLDNLLSGSGSVPRMALAVSQGVTRGALVRKVSPAYPAQARSMRLEGAVVLTAVVNETGVVQDVKVVSGHPVLARAAVEAVRQWRYQPSLLNGKAVKVDNQITVNFKAP
jgi:TonB family protein